MAELNYKCNEDNTELTFHFHGVPVDDSAPGRDGYFLAVYNDDTGENLMWVPGAEDNLHGVDYTVDVEPGADIYLFIANEAHSFSFEQDFVVVCDSNPDVAWEGPATTDPISAVIMTIVMTVWGIMYQVGRLLVG